MDTDKGEGIGCGLERAGWRGAKGGKIGTTEIEQIKEQKKKKKRNLCAVVPMVIVLSTLKHYLKYSLSAMKRHLVINGL